MYSNELKILIGVDLSAWTSPFALLLLSDPPRVYNSSRPPHKKHGPPGNLLIFLGHAAHAAARFFQQLGC
jgi:hypothetical protein